MVGTGTRERAGYRAPERWDARATDAAPAGTAAAAAEAACGRRRRYGFGAAAAAASSFLMMSVVISRPGSAQTTPESTLLNTMCRLLAADTSESTGRSLRWKSSC